MFPYSYILYSVKCVCGLYLYTFFYYVYYIQLKQQILTFIYENLYFNYLYTVYKRLDVQPFVNS